VGLSRRGIRCGAVVLNAGAWGFSWRSCKCDIVSRDSSVGYELLFVLKIDQVVV
jgi:hypothetical protein